MTYLISVLSVVAMATVALAIILVTLRDHSEAIVAALAGRSIHADTNSPNGYRVRVTVRSPVRYPILPQPLRAAA